MPDKKLNFFRLAVLFAGLTAFVLMMLWTAPQEPKAQRMGSSMGNMMKEMQVKNLSIYDLFDASQEQNQTAQDGQKGQANEEGELSGHHTPTQVMARLNFLTTAIVFVLLPLIIGGAIMLAIAWIR